MSTSTTKLCVRCVLPENFPGIHFNEDGLCSICVRDGEPENFEEKRQAQLDELEQLFDDYRGRGIDYDCILAFSGGKDSSYTLSMLKNDYQLSVLAITVDNGFLSGRAIENCRLITRSLGVDHIFFTPNHGFMTQMYRESLRNPPHTRAAASRASDICNSCIGLINNVMVKYAIKFGANIVAGGYLGGQVPRDATLVRLRLPHLKYTRDSAVKSYEASFGPDTRKYFGLPEGDQDKEIIIVNPLLAIQYDEDQILRELEEIGWRRPDDTGALSSNCRLNDLGIFIHEKKYGFNPYVAELADLVRRGYLQRDEALVKLSKKPSQSKLDELATELNYSTLHDDQ